MPLLSGRCPPPRHAQDDLPHGPPSVVDDVLRAAAPGTESPGGQSPADRLGSAINRSSRATVWQLNDRGWVST